MEKLKSMFSVGLVNRVRNSIGAAIVAGASATPAFAQSSGGSSMDVTALLATIAAAVVAYNLVGPAWAGLKVLKKAWNKIS